MHGTPCLNPRKLVPGADLHHPFSGLRECGHGYRPLIQPVSVCLWRNE
ncbi:Hypothetical protein AA314_03429 [Archangium gephyra]|uniref:Uncharacterized protein n=1 Tax=Archangium gephyra TaxID=48 RepID=A0AAC8Q646_9BACT|nr:Hypothetical protein AA314_03429 [Archangium gephyra]